MQFSSNACTHRVPRSIPNTGRRKVYRCISYTQCRRTLSSCSVAAAVCSCHTGWCAWGVKMLEDGSEANKAWRKSGRRLQRVPARQKCFDDPGTGDVITGRQLALPKLQLCRSLLRCAPSSPPTPSPQKNHNKPIPSSVFLFLVFSFFLKQIWSSKVRT